MAIKTNQSGKKIYEAGYADKYKDYKFRIDWTDSEPFNPENGVVDVIMTTKDGNEYYANFATPEFIHSMFEKNRKTGECLEGSYFCMPNLVLVRRIDEDIIKRTIDALIDNLGIDDYFKQISQFE